jgi:hypothetical protein
MKRTILFLAALTLAACDRLPTEPTCIKPVTIEIVTIPDKAAGIVDTIFVSKEKYWEPCR